MRLVDATQYQSRQNDFDFDIIASRIMFDATPIDGIEQIFGSASADMPSGSNLSGIKNKVVDALVAQGGAMSRAAKNWSPCCARSTACCDRSRSGFLPGARMRTASPCGTCSAGRTTKPDYGFSPETTWWFDAEKAVAIGKAD